MKYKTRDELEKEIAELKGRTCLNCKNWNNGLNYCRKLNLSIDIGGCGDYWEDRNE